MSAPLWLGIAAITAVAMEPWARLVHSRVWHGPLYGTHRSHHEPTGRLEANDLFALVHAVPAAALIIWGCGDHGGWEQLAFGVGTGMTAFGAAYAIVHDGFIHGRLPVGFLGRFRWLRRIRAAHRAHHLTGEAPYGLFWGPAELRAHGRAAGARRQEQRQRQG